jgi:RNase P subunit RPR2
MSFWSVLLGKPSEPENNCPHNLIRAHTTSMNTRSQERYVTATCLDCAESLRFELGRVVESMVSTIMQDVLKARGYQKDPEQTLVWLRVRN